MIFDRDMGTLTLYDSLVIRPNLTRQEFEASELARRSEPLVNNPPWMSYALPKGTRKGREVGAQIYFEGERLQRVDLIFARIDGPKSWAEWTRENEMEIQRYHDALLLEEFGPPEHDRYRFEWGEVASVYDDKGGFSLIAVVYK
jgi:hypothetical protein